jgi:hypothetical protein
LTLGTATAGRIALNLAYLFAFAGVGAYLSYRAHRKKLIT